MFFSVLLLVTCLFFLCSANPVHGVLTLVVLGLGFAGSLLVQGLEFAALVVVLVYVGAVTVLFVFVVMMVNLRVVPASYLTAESAGVAAAVAAAAAGWSALGKDFPTGVRFHLHRVDNLSGMGWSLYGTEDINLVVVVGTILFVAMVSAICLSLAGGENYRTQEFYSQIRKPNAVFVLRSR